MSIFPGMKGLPNTPWQGAESDTQAVTPAVNAQCQYCGSFPLMRVIPLISQPSGWMGEVLGVGDPVSHAWGLTDV